MKRKPLLILCIAALLLTGCSNTAEPIVTNASSDVTESTSNSYTSGTSAITLETSLNDSTLEVVESTLETSPNDSTLEAVNPTLDSSAAKDEINAPETGNAYYDNEFKGTTNNTGAPMSYEDVMDMLKVGEDEHGEKIDSFFIVETIKALSLDECAELAGWTEDYADRTIYKVNVLKDLISGEEVNRTENIFVSMGNIQWQASGDPIYAPGEKFTVVLAKPQNGFDFLRTPGSFMFRYDVTESATGDIELYARNNPIDASTLDIASDIDTLAITSTTLNPANYTQTVDLTELIEFLRADWQERELSTYYNEGA